MTGISNRDQGKMVSDDLQHFARVHTSSPQTEIRLLYQFLSGFIKLWWEPTG